MKIRPHIAISETGLIFNPETGESFVVNQIGLEILNLIKTGRHKPEIEATIRSKYDVTSEQFEIDYMEFLMTMKQYLLLG